MSNDIINNLPDAVETGTGARAWRIADGHFCRGRSEDGTIETRDRFLGYFRRVGIHEGQLDDGRNYAKLEIDLETRTGIESIGAALLSPTAGKPSYTSCIALANTALALREGQLVQLETVLSSQPNRYGKRMTFLNAYSVDQITLKPTRMRFEPISGDLDEALNALIERVRQHPAYAPRKRADGGADNETPAGGPTDELAAAVAEKGWPGLDLAADAYLKMASITAQKAGLPNGFASLGDVPADILSAMAQAVREAKKLPKLLEPYAAMAEDDPFV